MKHKIAVQVNGKSHEHEVAPRQLLVHYLRENLGSPARTWAATPASAEPARWSSMGCR